MLPCTAVVSNVKGLVLGSIEAAFENNTHVAEFSAICMIYPRGAPLVNPMFCFSRKTLLIFSIVFIEFRVDIYEILSEFAEY